MKQQFVSNNKIRKSDIFVLLDSWVTNITCQNIFLRIFFSSYIFLKSQRG
jgi:hypothetical protein